ncbi:MAG: resolvase [Deinococcota bacterium]|nr:resolvase [Deinococcota bacterium]
MFRQGKFVKMLKTPNTSVPGRFIGLDPGRNLGVAHVDDRGVLERAEIILFDELAVYPFPRGAHILVGDGTGTARVQRVLGERGLPFAVVDERNTTLEARGLYFRDHPPALWMRLLPKGLWSPPRPIDDYAAYATVLRYLEQARAAEKKSRDSPGSR